MKLERTPSRPSQKVQSLRKTGEVGNVPPELRQIVYHKAHGRGCEMWSKRVQNVGLIWCFQFALGFDAANDELAAIRIMRVVGRGILFRGVGGVWKQTKTEN